VFVALDEVVLMKIYICSSFYVAAIAIVIKMIAEYFGVICLEAYATSMYIFKSIVFDDEMI